MEDEYFSEIFNDNYESHFLDLIMPEYESFITQPDFVKTVMRGNYKGHSCIWIFDPARLREMYLDLFDFKEK